MPLDFKMFDFEDLEDGARALFHMKGEWMYRGESTPIVTDHSESTIPHRMIIDEWWSAFRPEMNGGIAPLVKEIHAQWIYGFGPSRRFV